ncbi:MAG TPA: hypothetical protein VF526_00030 [Solirubrobacteraceae bacterium]|jgi:hypothetical protein
MIAACLADPASALPRTLDGEGPAATLNALATAGFGARTGLICFGALRMILAAATPATGHSREQTMMAASGNNAALACCCELAGFAGAVVAAWAPCVMPPAPTAAIMAATAIDDRMSIPMRPSPRAPRQPRPSFPISLTWPPHPLAQQDGFGVPISA